MSSRKQAHTNMRQLRAMEGTGKSSDTSSAVLEQLPSPRTNVAHGHDGWPRHRPLCRHRARGAGAILCGLSSQWPYMTGSPRSTQVCSRVWVCVCVCVYVYVYVCLGWRVCRLTRRGENPCLTQHKERMERGTMVSSAQSSPSCAATACATWPSWRMQAVCSSCPHRTANSVAGSSEPRRGRSKHGLVGIKQKQR
jgi:hypothetical protein